MSSSNNPQATTQPPAEETAAPVAPAADAPPPAEAAPEGNPPVVDGIIRLRASDGNLYEYSIHDFSEGAAREVYTLLPPIWQQKIDAQAAFFENYENTITGIPEELREPGAFEKYFKRLSEQGGYLGDETPAAVRAWLDGPNGAGLRSNGYYKGYATADAIGTILASGYKVGSELIPKYFDALLLPVRGAAYATGWMGETLTNAPTITPEKARTLATAYQGMMYMATESEFAPKETKTEAPGTVGTVAGGIQSTFNYAVVAGIAAWNYAIGWLTGEKVTWDEAWRNGEDYWTEGKGLQSASETAETNAVAASLEEVRPVIEEQLSRATIDGENISRFLGVKEGDIIAGKDGNVSTFAGQDAGLNPLMGPDGKTPLPTSAIQQNELGQVTGGLFQDWSKEGIASTGIAMGAAYGLTYKGIGQGFARTKIMGEKPALEKAHAAAATKLKAAEDAVDDYIDKSAKGQLKNWRGKPLDTAAAKKLGDALDADLTKAQDAFDNLDTKLNNLPADPIADAKASKNPLTRAFGNLTEAAEKKLPADAKLWDRSVNRLTALGRGPGALAAHVSGWGTNFASGVARGAADAISPGGQGPSVRPAFGKMAQEASDAIGNLAQEPTTSNMGKFGKAVGKWGTAASGVLTFVSPVAGFSTSEDATGKGIYTASSAGLGAAVWAAGGKQFTTKALGVGLRRIVPGAGLVMDGIDYADGTRTDNAQKQRNAAVSAATQGAGAAIGAAIGGTLGFFGFGVMAAPGAIAGATIGTTVAGFASMATVPLANRLWPVKTEPKAERATPAPQVAAVVDARQSIADLQLTPEELNAIMRSRMAVKPTQAGGAYVPAGGGQRPQVVRLNLGV